MVPFSVGSLLVENVVEYIDFYYNVLQLLCVCDILKHWLLCLFFIKNIIKHLGVCTEIAVTSIYN